MIVRRIEFPPENPEYPQFVVVLEDVYVSPRGLIFDRHRNLMPEVNFNADFWPRYCPAYGTADTNKIAQREINRRKITELPGDRPHIYAMHYFGFYVFGHLWDSLQPLIKIEEIGLKDGTLLVNRFTRHVNKIDRHFDLVGYDKTQRHNVKSLTFVHELWYPSVVCYPGRITTQGRDWLRRKYMDGNGGLAAANESPVAGLYLDRNDNQGRNKRRVVNNDHVIELLSDHGFQVIDGSESLQEHIRLFGAARRVVGPHGSMFRNVLFCGPDCRVLEFCPGNRRDTSLREVGETCGLDYQFVEVPGDENNNIEIELDILGDWLGLTERASAAAGKA